MGIINLEGMVQPFWQEIGCLFPELHIFPDAIEDNLREIEIRKSKLKM